jgi:hypothetical protein
MKPDETTMTVATMTIGELCVSVKSGIVNKVVVVMKRQMNSPPFLTFDEAVSSFESVRKYFCS